MFFKKTGRRKSVELPGRAEFKGKINRRWGASSSPTMANHDRKPKKNPRELLCSLGLEVF